MCVEAFCAVIVPPGGWDDENAETGHCSTWWSGSTNLWADSSLCLRQVEAAPPHPFPSLALSQVLADVSPHLPLFRCSHLLPEFREGGFKSIPPIFRGLCWVHTQSAQLALSRPGPELRAPSCLEGVKVHLHAEILLFIFPACPPLCCFKLAGSAVFCPPTVWWIRKGFCKEKMWYLKPG